MAVSDLIDDRVSTRFCQSSDDRQTFTNSHQVTDATRPVERMPFAICIFSQPFIYFPNKEASSVVSSQTLGMRR